jgi:hypothetical protein
MARKDRLRDSSGYSTTGSEQEQAFFRKLCFGRMGRKASAENTFETINEVWKIASSTQRIA